MDANVFFSKLLEDLIDQLEGKNISEKYKLYYFRLFIFLKGANGYLSHKEISRLWGIEIASVKNILSEFENKSLIARERRSKQDNDNNHSVLFLILLIRPQLKD